MLSKNQNNESDGKNVTTKENSTTTSNAYKLELEVATPEDMEDVGAVLSVGSTGGDVMLLGGDLGAGKTCFSRGFVRARTGFMDMRVTSPTYLLSNTYPADGGDVIIHHMDLYRLSEGKDESLAPLNLEYVLKNCISLIEWPSRLGDMFPENRLEILFQIDTSDDSLVEEEDSDVTTRILTLTPYGERWHNKLKEIEEGGYLDDMILEDE